MADENKEKEEILCLLCFTLCPSRDVVLLNSQHSPVGRQYSPRFTDVNRSQEHSWQGAGLV